MRSEAPVLSGAATGRRGRAARLAEAAAPNGSGARPVWPGVEGGTYRPLSDADMARIHATVLDLLEQVGLAQAIPSMVDLVTARGGRLTEEGRLLFPRGLVEEVIAKTRRDVVIHGQRPGLEMDLSGARVHMGTGGASPSIVDLETGAYRGATLRDLYDVARLVDALEHIHFFHRSLVARDVTDPRVFDLNTAYACAMGTAKPLGTSFAQAEHVHDCMEMLSILAGGRESFLKRPFCTLLSCHVVPPMRFAEDACHALEAGVRLGMPVMLISAGQAGATSPAPLAGSVVQAVAETLAGLVFVHLIDPRVQVIFAPKPLVSDLRTGSMTGGSGEQAVLMAAAAQMGRFYDLPTSSMAGMTDAKVPDAQHGYEKCCGVTLAAQAGCNYISQACGLEASLLGCAYESYVIDNDMLGAVLRTVRGIEVDEESLSFDSIREVVSGEGHYLGHHQTIQRMTSDYLYPDLGDRRSPDQWEEDGAQDIRQRAQARAREILAEHRPGHVDPARDAAVRAAFDIRLPPEALKLP